MYRITHCGSGRKTVLTWLHSHISKYDYILLYITYCPNCRKRSKTHDDDSCRVMEWQGFSLNTGKHSINRVKPDDQPEWLNRQKHQAVDREEKLQKKPEQPQQTRAMPHVGEHTRAMSLPPEGYLYYLEQQKKLPLVEAS